MPTFKSTLTATCTGAVLMLAGQAVAQTVTDAQAAMQAGALDAASDMPAYIHSMGGPVTSRLRLANGRQISVSASWEQKRDSALVTVTTKGPLTPAQFAPFSAAARGIKDNAIKACGKCGCTSGRVLPGSAIHGDMGYFQLRIGGLSGVLQPDQIDAILATSG